jgi:hypothetical protein
METLPSLWAGGVAAVLAGGRVGYVDARTLQKEMQDLESSWPGHNRKTTRTEVTEADRPSILAKVVAVSVVYGVEQVFAGGWERVKEREQD